MSRRTPLFDSQNHDKHIGNDKPLHPRFQCLKQVEEYFIDECIRRKVRWSFDCTANESFYFKTLNYTTYAGMLIVHPLQPEVSLQQVHQAFLDKPKVKNYSEYLLQRYHDQSVNKYDYKRDITTDKEIDAVVVLPGENKIRTNICVAKLKWILETHGDRVLFKPHPLTLPETIEQLKEQIGAKDCHFASLHCDLYDLIDRANIIYTTHISESALYGRLLDKQISPIDAVQSRMLGSFTHINHYLFNDLNAKEWIDTVFSSHRSGIFHPEIDEDWKTKMYKYMDYILNIKEQQKNFYIQK